MEMDFWCLWAIVTSVFRDWDSIMLSQSWFILKEKFFLPSSDVTAILDLGSGNLDVVIYKLKLQFSEQY